MPLYEFVCSNCGHLFEQLVRSANYDTHAIVCPACQRSDVQKKLSTFAVRGAGTRAEAMSSAASCAPGGG